MIGGLAAEFPDKSLAAIYLLEGHAVHCIRSEEYERAAKCLLAGLSIVMPASDECRLRLRLGILLDRHLHQPTLALDSLQKAYRLSPPHQPDLKYRTVLALGQALERGGRGQLALNLYEEQLIRWSGNDDNDIDNSGDLEWLETFVIAKAKILCQYGKQSAAIQLLEDCLESYPTLEGAREFLAFSTKTALPGRSLFSLLVQTARLLKEGDYFGLSGLLKELMTFTGPLLLTAHLQVGDRKQFRHLLRLLSISYAVIDGKLPVPELLQQLEKLPPEFTTIKEQVKNILYSYQQKTTPKSLEGEEMPPNIARAVHAYEAKAPLHLIKEYLLESLKEINNRTENANMKAVTLLLLAWVYRESDFDLALKLGRAVQLIGEWRESPLLLMLAHGIIGRMYEMKGDRSEAQLNWEKAEMNRGKLIIE